MADHDGAHRLDTPVRDGSKDEHEQGVNDPVRANARPADRSAEQRTLPPKTSAAAVFALVIGLSALLSVLTLLLTPLAVVLSIVGIVLGVVGLKMTKRVGVTGKGVAIGGLVLSVLALILSVVAVAGVTTVLNNDKAVDRLDQQVQKLRDNLPDKVEVPQP